VVGPTLEGGAHFVGVLGPLIDARDPRAVAGIVVEDRFDVVGLDAEFA
jgi:hypothetical protein